MRGRTADIIDDSTFSNNSGNQSVIMIDQSDYFSFMLCSWENISADCSINVIRNCLISDNNMTGIVILKTFYGFFIFIGRNVIQNNRNTQGAGIVLMDYIPIIVNGELLLYTTTLLINMAEQFL